MKSTYASCSVLALVTCLFLPASARAQTGDSRWNVEASVGWDIGLSGDFLSAGIGTLNGVPVVIQSQSWNTVYGTGIQWKAGAGYALDDQSEVRGQFAYQRSGSDAVLVGKAGTSDLYGTFDDMKVWTFEGGYRRYFERHDKLRPFGELLIGIADIPRINGVFAATQTGSVQTATDLYDGTAAFTFAVNAGALYRLNDRADFKVQLGFRHVSGLAQVDDLQGTGLENINDKSGRWSLPIELGVHIRF